MTRMSTWPRAPTVWNSEWRYAPNLGLSAPGTSQGPPRTSPDRSRADPEQTKPKSFRPRGRTRRGFVNIHFSVQTEEEDG